MSVRIKKILWSVGAVIVAALIYGTIGAIIVAANQ